MTRLESTAGALGLRSIANLGLRSAHEPQSKTVQRPAPAKEVEERERERAENQVTEVRSTCTSTPYSCKVRTSLRTWFSSARLGRTQCLGFLPSSSSPYLFLPITQQPPVGVALGIQCATRPCQYAHPLPSIPSWLFVPTS